MFYEKRFYKLVDQCDKGLVKEPIGAFVKRCPTCKSKLKRVYPFGDYTHRVCSCCGYEWAESTAWQNN